MTEGKQLRIAVAGAGAIGRRHIDLVLRSRDCLLMAIADPAPGAAAISNESGVPLFSSLTDLIAHERPDGVILATPNSLHLENGLACIAAGIPTLIEKPLADSIESGQRLCEAAERANVKLLTGHHRQHNPIMEKAMAVIRSGQLGRLVAVVGTEMFCKPDRYFDDGHGAASPAVVRSSSIWFMKSGICARYAVRSRPFRLLHPIQSAGFRLKTRRP
ncbi:MAG: Gfo/Idh/MocA family oxidoreductase [Pseudolabrys sp.]